MTSACEWCGRQLAGLNLRPDAKFCSVQHRQASWRFGVRRSNQVATERPMRFAYADPPYPGKAGYYRDHPAYGGEVDHRDLVAQLQDDYPDGWALSTSSEALHDVWALCPEARLNVWVKGGRRTKAVRALRAWEPVLVAGGRPLSADEPQEIEDVLDYRGRYRAFPGALMGMKPPQFAVWVFRLLGAGPGDDLVDLFPGSGAVTAAWSRYVGNGIPVTDASSIAAERLEEIAAAPGDASQSTRPTAYVQPSLLDGLRDRV